MFSFFRNKNKPEPKPESESVPESVPEPAAIEPWLATAEALWPTEPELDETAPEEPEAPPASDPPLAATAPRPRIELETAEAAPEPAPESDPDGVTPTGEPLASVEDITAMKAGFFARFMTGKGAPAEQAPQPEAPKPVKTPPVEATAPRPRIEIVEEPVPPAPLPKVADESVEEVPAQKVGFFARIKQGLARTSSQFSEGLGNLLLGKKEIDDELMEEIETQLLVADVGIDATTEIIDELTAKVARKQLADSGALYQALQEQLRDMLLPVEKPLTIDASRQPYVILVVGVNGVGKTTTIGKLTKQLQSQGKSVMLAAGDTFRAAAVEQLQVWGDRNKVPVIAQPTGSDSASVIFDAISAARARNIEVVIADTAGRLQNKRNLMEELAKVRRVMGKLDDTAPHEVLLVLDAGTGQNAVSQADTFREIAGVTGLVLTKLDGTAKGGIIFALSQKHKLPVRFIGVGEAIDDLQPFAAQAFVDALFDKSEPR